MRNAIFSILYELFWKIHQFWSIHQFDPNWHVGQITYRYGTLYANLAPILSRRKSSIQDPRLQIYSTHFDGRWGSWSVLSYQSVHRATKRCIEHCETPKSWRSPGAGQTTATVKCCVVGDRSFRISQSKASKKIALSASTPKSEMPAPGKLPIRRRIYRRRTSASKLLQELPSDRLYVLSR